MNYSLFAVQATVLIVVAVVAVAVMKGQSENFEEQIAAVEIEAMIQL